MVKITSIINHSIADDLGISSGDFLLSINNSDIDDVLDYRYYMQGTAISLLIKHNEEFITYEIEKDEFEDIGLKFLTPLMDEKHSCSNKCIFCFIDQNPKKMRESIYFKDDDSRLSFIQGNYITLTNLKQDDVDRIISMHMSPINISVHTSEEQLRVFMMKNKNAGRVLRYIDDFANGNIEMHCQIVLCKGINDGNHLFKTLKFLEGYYPHINSISVVPAGLTKYRDDLFHLEQFTAEESKFVIDLVNGFGDKSLSRHGERVFYCSDEFYINANRELPNYSFYEDFSQIENGVGMVSSFCNEFMDEFSKSKKHINVKKHLSCATGVASYPFINKLVEKIRKKSDNFVCDVYCIQNEFYGKSITVSGLLTGIDIYNQLKNKDLGSVLFLPSNTLNNDKKMFIDNMTPIELSKRLSGIKIKFIENNGRDFYNALIGE